MSHIHTKPVALVTGSASGIGRSTVLRLAQQGYDVVINYSVSEAKARATAEDAEALGAATLVVRADVSDGQAVRNMLAAVQERFGRLDALVNNAGTTVLTPPADLEGLTEEAWDRVFAVNVKGLWLVTRASAPLLREAPNAAIVNIASIVGLRPGPQPLPYAASKAAIVNLTKTLAGALGPSIRVNAVAPGWMEGDWMQRTLGENYERLMERRAKATPLKRCVTPEDVAETIVNLIVSNPFVNGQIIIIDGGYTSTV
jgi:3-oxoacyl-[acyl-carrier protein] reductase